MKNKDLNKYANKLVNAFLNNKIISPLPIKYTKKLSEAQKLRKLCESKINKPISNTIVVSINIFGAWLETERNICAWLTLYKFSFTLCLWKFSEL